MQRPGARLAHQRLHGKEPFQLAAAKPHRQPFAPGVVIHGFKGEVGECGNRMSLSKRLLEFCRE